MKKNLFRPVTVVIKKDTNITYKLGVFHKFTTSKLGTLFAIIEFEDGSVSTVGLHSFKFNSPPHLT